MTNRKSFFWYSRVDLNEWTISGFSSHTYLPYVLPILSHDTRTYKYTWYHHGGGESLPYLTYLTMMMIR